MRSRECQTDMEFVVGNLVLQSPLHALERSVANILTREIFLLFRPMLTKACSLKVRSCTLTPTCEIYTFHGRAIHGRSGRHIGGWPRLAQLSDNVKLQLWQYNALGGANKLKESFRDVSKLRMKSLNKWRFPNFKRF
ncbi:hypothetical protein HN51_058306 [Arachis hypogaea]